MGRGEADLEEMRFEKLDRESKEKDSHRSRDKDKDAYKEMEKERDRVRERDRDKEREQKDKDKSKDAERDRERHRDKEKERDKESERDKQRIKDRDREKDKEREREREKERDKERERDREREREKEREKERERDREKDRDRERLKERERERDRDKMREKEREKVRERDSRLRELEKDKDAEYRRDRLKDIDRDIERDRDIDKEKRKGDRDRDRKEREREKEKERDVERERDRDDREREREKKREKEKDRDRDREKEREVDRDRDNREHPRSRQKGNERERDKELEKMKDRTKEIHSTKEKDRGKDEERSQRELDKSQISSMDLEERIVKMKEDRIRNLDRRKAADKEDEQSEITAWVNRSRKLQEQAKVNEKEKATRMARTLAEQEFEEKSDEEYETKDLAGLKIRHGLDKVMEGGAVVLTLKDRNILDGDDVDEEMDELENIEIAEQKAREDAYKAAKKKPGIYEDKFHNEFSEPRTILPQYDDVVKDDGVVLDETGGINEQSRKRLEEIRQRLQNATVRGLAQDSVASEAARVAADFYTQEEMLQFKKPKKKKKLRKKIDIDIDALEAEAKAAGLGTGDLGSRVSAGRNGKKEEERAVADSKRNAYQNAYVKALEASKVLRSESSTAMDMDTDGPVFGADEDDELHRSLERARFAALKKQAENGGSVAGPQAVAARLAALKEETGSGSQHQGVAEGETEKPVVITDTGEFCLSLQLDEVISRRAGAKDVFGEEDDVGPAATKDLEVSNKEGGWIEVREVDQKDSLSAEEEEENILEEPIQEVAVGKGLAGALNLLKERGTLKETIDWGGRNMDKKRSKLVGIVDDNPPEQTRQRDILLDRVDEFGRTMTPKEAFRRLSHKFHGKGPGKMKQEKKMKQYQEELKLKQMNSGDTPLMSMEKMREAQAKMHTPYIVISGHIKPGQTSDPRSGFATVEKEPIGSLTPMLGDKKVEHFLGIKRKSEVGSMGPPPPKKPKSER